MEFENQYLNQEQDEQREINLQYQRLIKKILPNNRDLKKENDELKNENKELINKINYLNKKLSKNQPDIPVFNTNQTNNQALSRQYQDIRYFQVNGNNRPLSSDLISTVHVNGDDLDRDEIIDQLKESNLKLKREYESLRIKYEDRKQAAVDWERRCKLLKQRLNSCEKDLFDLRNARIQELSKDPRFLNNLNKEKAGQMEELIKLNESLQARIDRAQEDHQYDFVNVKKEKMDAVEIEQPSDIEEYRKPFEGQPKTNDYED